MTEKEPQTVECPDCNQKIQKSKVLEHVRTCRMYRKKFLNNISRTIDVTSKNNLRFMYAELELAMEKFDGLLSDSDDQSARKQPRFNQNKDAQIDANERRRQEKKVDKKPSKGIDKKVLSRLDQQQKADQSRNHFSPLNGQTHSVFDNYLEKQQNQSSLGELKQKSSYLEKVQKQRSYLDALLESSQQPNQVYEEDHIQCSKCHRKFTMNQLSEFVYADLCLHPICRKCMDTYLEKEYVKANGKYKYPCPHLNCKEQIPYYQLAEIYGKQKMEAIDNELNKGFMADLINCISCKQKFQFIKGKPTDAPMTNNEGKKLNDFYRENFANFRFVCPTCKTEQCKTCQSTPYHLGETCEEHKISKAQKKCRYCEQSLPLNYKNAQEIKTFDDICGKEDCQKRLKLACPKILKCNHSCNGFSDQTNCLPCLNEKCASENKKQLIGQDENGFCNICFIQTLKNAPCIQSKCGHIFHYECLLKRLKTRWFGPRVLFNFCHCPLCNTWIEVPKESEIFKILSSYKELQKNVKDKALKRLKVQNEDKNERLKDPNSPYYKNQEKYSMAIYAYFECWKCKKPYFGGRKSCADAMNDQQQGGEFKPEELVCPQCVPATEATTNCPTHGKDFISFKCKFCCSIAVWFCWGTTHFCQPCHKKQIDGDQLTKMSKQKLPKCQGPGKCPIGGDHGGNGDTKSLGCSLCTDLSKKNQDF